MELANSLRGLLGEVRKTICYFQDPESFDVEYAQFVKSSGRPAASKEIMIDTWVLPLYGLYLEVISVGGFVQVLSSNQLCSCSVAHEKQVTHDMGWERVFRRLSPSSKAGMANTQNAPFTFALESALKEAYLLYLYPYEYSRRLEWVGKDL